jgi:uncharacterized protein
MASVIYLHGFASSPGGSKAAALRPVFERAGAQFLAPDLNVPCFEQLSLTAMLATIAAAVTDCEHDGPVFLIGSSLGGLAAVHFLDRYRDGPARSVAKAALLAPAFDFAANRERDLGPGWLARWQEQGQLPIFHYGTGTVRPLDVGFVEDLLRYRSDQVRFPQPLLIYHGTQDESVDYEQSVRFAAGRPGVDLRLLAADHSLLAEIDGIAQGLLAFFLGAR